jgi:citrate lyase subunit alpha/citrate CoA-transferase
MVLGAAEVDLEFNVNVSTGFDGRILGGSGGHADTADGAELSIVTTQLTSRLAPKIVRQVNCVTTPGSTVDVVVTEAGIAVNPLRDDVRQRLVDAGLPVKSMPELLQLAEIRRQPEVKEVQQGRVVGVVEYRDGSVTDVIRAVPASA